MSIFDDLTEEQAQAVKDYYKDYIPKSRFDEVNERMKTAEAAVADRDKQIEDLSKQAGSVDDLKATIEDLKDQNAKAKEESDQRLKELTVSNALGKAIAETGGRDELAIKAHLDADRIQVDKDGNVSGLEEQVQQLKESAPYLFASKDGKPEIKGARPAAEPEGEGTGKPDFRGMSYQQIADYMSEHRDD